MAVLGTNNLVKVQTYSTGYNEFQSTTGGSSWITLNTDQTNYTGTRNSGDAHIMEFTKLFNTSDLKIVVNIPAYLATGGSGIGIRLQISKDNSTYYADALDNGPAHAWGAFGYGGNTVGIIRFEWNTEFIDAVRSSGIYSHTGTVYWYVEYRVWSTDTFYPLSYSSTAYPKYGTMQVYEIAR